MMPGDASPADWAVWRQDDHGNEVRVRSHLTRSEAEALVARLEAGGHKQVYWISRDGDPSRPEPL